MLNLSSYKKCKNLDIKKTQLSLENDIGGEE